MTKDDKCATNINKELTKAQQDFLDFCKELGYGKAEVLIRDGQPVYASYIKQDHKFG